MVFTELPLQDFKNRICGTKTSFSSAEQAGKKTSIRLALALRCVENVTFTVESVTAQFVSLVALTDEGAEDVVALLSTLVAGIAFVYICEERL